MTKLNRLHQSRETTKPHPGPCLPSLDSRPMPAWFRVRFPANVPERRPPNENFSPYSQPLPIARDTSTHQKEPGHRHRILRELKAQRDRIFQKAFLGSTVSAAHDAYRVLPFPAPPRVGHAWGGGNMREWGREGGGR
ncbi:hypothetical protein BDK51DRAFT_29270 [Blyttiomyces helicus]|uniref:Uncharacterized protein n=1 Tax=Blyttiomyces helicus TaxID=388810 RepID=A0A4P9VWQ6_9FUNG|nr:hypothetical protein BDK51DRAFT_29270 [Blyttiomyces helicus]|eukprot:RKO84134.1 hypothetical protein BDK51DRAFT_29270 [Blyttiomyces helicus]